MQNIYTIFVRTDNPLYDPSLTGSTPTIWDSLELDDLNLESSFSIEEITDITKRKDTITKSIVLKGTKKNNQILGALYNIDRDTEVTSANIYHNYKPNKYVDCFVLENNIQVLKGKLLVTSISIRKNVILYSCNIVGTSFSFFSELNDRKLEELDYFALAPYNNIPYTQTSITSSWTANSTNNRPNLFSFRNSVPGVQWTDGTINADGEYGQYSRTSEYIAVKPNTTYIFNRNYNISTQSNYFRIGQYTDRTVDSHLPTLRVTSTNLNVTVTTGPDTKFIRFSTYMGAGYDNTNPTRDFKWYIAAGPFNVKMEEKDSDDLYSGYRRNPDDYQSYLFPMIDYGGTLENVPAISYNNTKFRYDVFRPAIYVKSYLDAIFCGWRPYTPDQSGDLSETADYTQGTEDPASSPRTLQGDYLNKYKWDATEGMKETLARLFIPHNEPNISLSVPTTPVTLLFDPSEPRAPNNGSSSPSPFELRIPMSSSVSIAKGSSPQRAFTSTDPIQFNDYTGGSSLYTSLFSYVAKDVTTPVDTGTQRILHLPVIAIKKPMDAKWWINAELSSTGIFRNSIYQTKPGNANIAIYKVVNNVMTDLIFAMPIQQSHETTYAESTNQTIVEGEYAVCIYIKEDSVHSYTVSNNSETTTVWPVTIRSYMTQVGITSTTSNNNNKNLTAYSTIGDNLSLYDNIPKSISVRDFLKNIMIMFNLYLIPDLNVEDKFWIYSYQEFYKNIVSLNRDESLDWSEKADYSSYTLESNTDLPRGYFYTYKEDKDLMNTLYKDTHNEIYGQFKILDTSGLTDEKKVELMFSPTINLTFGGRGISVPVMYDADVIGAQERKPIKTNIRILYYSGAVDLVGSTYSIVNAQGDALPTSSPYFFNKYPLSSMFIYNSAGVPTESLCFGKPLQDWANERDLSQNNNYLFDIYHKDRIKDLVNPNTLFMTIDVHLTEDDISNLDFRTPIYLQSPYGSSYFKLLSVDYYDSTRTSKVKLQKITTSMDNPINLITNPQAGYVRESDGAEIASPNWLRSGKLPVVEGERYAIKTFVSASTATALAGYGAGSYTGPIKDEITNQDNFYIFTIPSGVTTIEATCLNTTPGLYKFELYKLD